MSPSAKSLSDYLSRRRDTSWALTLLTRLPAGGRIAAILGLGCGVLAIGWVDYVTGTRMSFVVFYLGPVALAVSWLGRLSGIITAVASVVIRFVADSTDDAATVHETWLWWNSVGSLFVYLAIVWLLDALIRFHRQLERRVQLRTLELEREVRKRQEVQRELLELSDNERSAMGRELHDQLGQHLVGTAMAAQVLAHKLHGRDEPGGREARKIADLVEQGIAQTRQLAHGLLLTSLDPSRFASELEELCAALRQQYPKVQCRCRIEATPLLRHPAIAAQLFRIGQEALRNAMRHSGATVVDLAVESTKAGLTLSVTDNGRGLPPAEQRHGMGLRIMKHRAEHLRGEFNVANQASGGTRVTCVLPASILKSKTHGKREDPYFPR
ncbi:MAG: sensor histidine kinase [Candidatus Didemnitutus sp.]|nr:sensor histidine kinase [Candidatus Didemnitutus sp.]